MNQNNLKQATTAPLVSIVDDDASVRSSMRRLLRSSALRAETFASAEEFLQSKWVGKTDCLLLDVSMPGMGGLELQRQISESERKIPIVFLSARATEEEERRAMQRGAAAFLHKPARQESLLNAIRTALADRAG